jgi:sugar lactone lactonase YvrE
VFLFCILSNLFLAESGLAQSIYENYTFTTLAGPDEAGPGWQDGRTNEAHFGTPGAVARDGAGNIYVADPFNNTIRKISPDGAVTTVAGSTGFSGSTDGVGSVARFKSPSGIAIDGAGNLFVADTGNHTIRKISPAGLVTTFAGLAGSAGATNGAGNLARFSSPFGVMVDQNNNVYVADTFNDTIRIITPTGVVSTLAGTAGVSGAKDKTGAAATFTHPVSLAMDSNGNIYVADTGNDLIRKIAPGAVVTTLAGTVGVTGSADGTNGTARFNSPYAITVDSTDAIYVADTLNNTIRKITLSGVVTTPAGLAGVAGSADGVGNQARFTSPTGLAAGNGTDLVVADFGNASVRRVTGEGTTVTTVSGVASAVGSQDGSANAALFNFPAGTAVDAGGNVYVADEQNHVIRKITPLGDVSTFAGTSGVAGTNDANRTSAKFNRPLGVAFDGGGSLYVADSHNHTIRKITPDGTVTTLAGQAGTTGTNDGFGAAAQFNTPFSLTIDALTNIYVADTFNHAIRKITALGEVSTLAGTINVLGTNDGTGTAASFSFPEGIAVDPDGNVFVTDDGNSAVRKITPAGVVTTFAGVIGSPGNSDGVGSAARFNFPFGLVMDASRNLYVADTASHTIRKITPAGAVTTLGGVSGVFGNVDGTGDSARLNNPQGIAVDGNGTLYISDKGNQVIRKAYPALPDMPTVDFAVARVGVTRHLGITNLTTTSWSWKFIRYPSESSAQLSSSDTMNPTFTPDVEDSYLLRFQGWDNSGKTTIRILTLYADDTPPSLTITNPVSLQVISNGVFTVSGTATDNLGLSNVWIELNGGTRKSAVGTTNWSSALNLAVGTNVVRVYAEDFAGNFSPTNSATLVSILSAPLTVQVNGGGSVSPNFNGVLLEIGKTYSMTAQAGAGSAFVNWTGSLTTNSPILTFVMQSNLTFVANFTDPVRPTLAIVSPQKSSHISNAVFTATGTATDNGQLAQVWYRLNGGAWMQATNTSNWRAGLALSASANTLDAYAVDTFGNVSLTNTVAFTYVPSGVMRVLITGQGTLSPNYDGWSLELGKTYSMTAKAGFNFLFSGWTDGSGNSLSTASGLKFLVQSNMTIRANFTANKFPPLSGPFAGLFYDTNNVSLTNSGFFSATLTSVGAFSGKLQLASGQNISVSGLFSPQGVFSNSIAVKGSAPLVLQLSVDAVTGGRITGSVSGVGWTSPLLAYRAFYSVLNPAPQANKKYTLVIPGGDDSTVQPGGNGFGTISVSLSGNLTFSGILGDGTKAVQSTFLSQKSQWPFYIAPYKGQGVIFGWMTFTNESVSDLNGVVNWIKLPQATAKTYPAGFNFAGGIQAVGSEFSFTNGVPLLNLPSGGMVILQQGNPVQGFTNHFTLGADNKVVSADGLSVTITTASGLFKGNARNPGDGSLVPINGVLLQKQNSGFGFFLGTSQSGSVYFGP